MSKPPTPTRPDPGSPETPRQPSPYPSPQPTRPDPGQSERATPMTTVGNIIWATIAAASAIWFLLAFTAIGFPLVVAVVAAAAVWILVELALAYRSARRSSYTSEGARHDH